MNFIDDLVERLYGSNEQTKNGGNLRKTSWITLTPCALRATVLTSTAGNLPQVMNRQEDQPESSQWNITPSMPAALYVSPSITMSPFIRGFQGHMTSWIAI